MSRSMEGVFIGWAFRLIWTSANFYLPYRIDFSNDEKKVLSLAIFSSLSSKHTTTLLVSFHHG